MRRFAIAIVTATLLIGLAGGVARAATSSSPSPGGEKLVFRVGTMQDIDSLNPFAIVTVAAFEMFHLNYDLLVGYAPNGDPRPELADSWEASAGWSHLDLQDPSRRQLAGRRAAHGQRTSPSPSTTSSTTRSRQYLSSVVRTSRRSSPSTTPRSSSTLPSPRPTCCACGSPSCPEHIWSKVPGEKADYLPAPRPPVVGTGPFQVTEVKKGSYLLFAANKDYFQRRPQGRRGRPPDLPEPGHHDDGPQERQRSTPPSHFPVAQFNALKSESGHHGDRRPHELLRRAGHERLPQRRLAGRTPCCATCKFRQAISWAVDKQKIVDTALSGYGEVGQSIIEPFTDYGQWDAAARGDLGLRPGEGRRSCSTRPATRTRTGTASEKTSRASRSSCGSSRGASRPSSSALAS